MKLKHAALQLGLRGRLFLLVLVALAPAILILLSNVISLRQSREAEVHARALQIGNLAALEIQRIMTGAERLMTAVARVPAVRNFEVDECIDYLRGLGADNPQFVAISVIDREGVLRCRAPMPETPQRYSERAYFVRALAGEPFIVGNYTKTLTSGAAVLQLAVPIRNDAGDVTGVLAGGLNLEWLRDILRQRQFPNNDALTIADVNGVILAREPLSERFVGTKIPADFMRLVGADRPGTMEVTSQDGTRRIMGYFPPKANGSGLYISAGLGRDDAFAPINAATLDGVLMVLAGAVAAFLTAAFVGRSLIREPVRKLNATIQAWRRGDDSSRTGMQAENGELEAVGAAIDKFMDELAQGRLERAKAEESRELLMHEMEHRVKNVLATVQAIASQTLRKGAASPEALEGFFGRLQALASAHRILLMGNWEVADLRQVVSDAVRPFDRSPSRFDIEGPDIRIRAKAAWALAMAIHELCTNAAKYGALHDENGAVRIRWQIGDGSGDNLFRLCWVERDGPRVAEPSSSGFGSRMIARVLASEIRGVVTLDYQPNGLACRVRAPMEHVLLSNAA